jgi:hypothetical protein
MLTIEYITRPRLAKARDRISLRGSRNFTMYASTVEQQSSFELSREMTNVLYSHSRTRLTMYSIICPV